MAYIFPDSGLYIAGLHNTSFTLPALPFTLALWFKADTLALARQMITVGTGTTNYARLGTNASNQLVVQANAGALRTLASASSFTSGTWNHAAGTFASSASRTNYFNGVATSAQTTDAPISTPSIICVGGNIGGATTLNVNCYDINIAEVGIWDVALSADEITSLSKGIRPTKIRPQNLEVYLPLVRAPTGSAGTNVHQNIVGPTVSDYASNDYVITTTDHPRIY